MHHLEKLLRRLPLQIRERVVRALACILEGKLQGLDIKALAGYRDLFRCRIGTIRIIFKKQSDGSYVFVEANTRDKAYKKL